MLSAVIHDGKPLTTAALTTYVGEVDERDRAFVQACAYGVLRRFYSLRAELDGLLRRPLRSKESVLDSLLLAGLYQLRYMDVPAHAAVSATVEAARELNKSWACSLVNGVLRSALRAGRPTPAGSEEVFHEHPQWLIDACRRAWPEHWESILTANNAQAPMTVRVNRRRTTRDAYSRLLSALGIRAAPTRYSPVGLTLEQAAPVAALPGFAEGLVSVQDEAAQLAAALLQAGPGDRILDACAAPGGKTAHLLELATGTPELIALDRSAARIHDIEDTLRRLGLRCSARQEDAGLPDAWWDGVPFDRILLDAPCTATGVIRRHPDIKIHRVADDVATAARGQTRLLRQLWPLLHAGGRLLYASCSIMREENDEIVASLIEACKDAVSEPLDATWGHATSFGRQILPGEEGMDGFYYALLSKGAQR